MLSDTPKSLPILNSCTQESPPPPPKKKKDKIKAESTCQGRLTQPLMLVARDFTQKKSTACRYPMLIPFASWFTNAFESLSVQLTAGSLFRTIMTGACEPSSPFWWWPGRWSAPTGTARRTKSWCAPCVTSTSPRSSLTTCRSSWGWLETSSLPWTCLARGTWNSRLSSRSPRWWVAGMRCYRLFGRSARRSIYPTTWQTPGGGVLIFDLMVGTRKPKSLE